MWLYTANFEHMQSLSVRKNSFAPKVFQWQSAHCCCPTWHASGGFVTLLVGKKILLRSDVRKTFSLITVPKCEAVRRPRHSWNQSLLCDWPLVLHSMFAHCCKVRNTVICSSIDVRISILYIWFANRFASLNAFFEGNSSTNSWYWKGSIHNYWILKGPANNHSALNFS